MYSNTENEELQELRCLIWLQKVLGVGNCKSQKIISAFGGAQNVYFSGKEKRVFSGMFSARENERADSLTLSFSDEILAQCKRYGITAIGISDNKFPDCVRNIPDPPLVLYIKGEFPDFDNVPSFCIVGPREVSDFGKKAAFSLSARLSKAGMTIVSGGAKGADRFAHLGALKCGGITAAVLPCGIEFDYLNENKPLRDEIVKTGGCLISECPPKQGMHRHSFHIRNRLLSALSLGVAVVEAQVGSGALITARHACEQGRDVFVIPGNPTLDQYKGSNELLRDGAKPLIDASDIFNEYIVRFSDKLDLKKAFAKSRETIKEKKIQKKSATGLSKEAKIVYNNLDKQKFTADDINIDGISDDELLACLTELEMEQYIEALPGGYYSLL
ncbi:MAG: DNA-protecting protein DprA [Ruminococcaceae bacterium]|nr:DNA-protecting protein DprA [Oscillospiraceae bacterium]